jgi:hypothetical protein
MDSRVRGPIFFFIPPVTFSSSCVLLDFDSRRWAEVPSRNTPTLGEASVMLAGVALAR